MRGRLHLHAYLCGGTAPSSYLQLSSLHPTLAWPRNRDLFALPSPSTHPAGPVWKPPRPRTVLRGLPFMQAVPDAMFKQILAAGSIKGGWVPVLIA